MRIFRTLTLVVFVFAFAPTPASAQAHPIVGTWSAQADILLELDDEIVKVPRVLSVMIERVEGQLFVGERKWQAVTDDPGNVAGVDVLRATEPFIGAIDSDGVTLRMVETDDPGFMIGELLSPNELEITYMETWPHAVVYTVVLRRLAE